MNRRAFTKSMLLCSVAAPAVITGPAALANKEDKGREQQYARVVLRLLALTVVVATFLVLTNRGYLGLNLQGDVPVEPAERLDVSKVPLIGGLFNQNLAKQFADATPAGTLYLIGSTIFLLPLLVLSANMAVWLTNRNQVFKPVNKLRKVKLKTDLTEEQIKRGKVIGRAVLANNILLAIFAPSIFDGVEFKAK